MRVHSWRPLDNGIALRIDATASRASGELRVLSRGEVDVSLTVEFDEFLQHHRARRHINAKGQGLSGKNSPDQTLDEKLLHDVPERRQHTGMMGGEPTRQRFAPTLEVQDLQVFFRDSFHSAVHNGLDFGCFLRSGQNHAGAQALVKGTIAASAGKDKSNCRQHVHGLQLFKHLRAAERTVAVLGAGRSAAPVAALVACTRTEAGTFVLVAFVAVIGCALP